MRKVEKAAMRHTRTFWSVCAALLCLAARCPSAGADCPSDVRPIGVGIPALPFQFVAGREYALILGFAAGNYEFLNFSTLSSDCSGGRCGGLTGADRFTCLLEYGLGCCVDLESQVDILTGIATTPVTSAIDSLFGRDVVSTEYPAAQTNAYQTYLTAGGDGSRVLQLALVQFPASPVSGPATIKAFTPFFLKRRFSAGQKMFYGEFVPDEPTPAATPTWGRIKALYR